MKNLIKFNMQDTENWISVKHKINSNSKFVAPFQISYLETCMTPTKSTPPNPKPKQHNDFEERLSTAEHSVSF